MTWEELRDAVCRKALGHVAEPGDELIFQQAAAALFDMWSWLASEKCQREKHEHNTEWPSEVYWNQLTRFIARASQERGDNETLKETKEDAKRMRKEGMSNVAIGEAFGVTGAAIGLHLGPKKKRNLQ